VAAATSIVSVEVAPAVVGVTGLVKKEHETPAGSVAGQASVTGSGVPDTKVALIVFDPEPPGIAVIPPLFESE
jgi:hypothetical protein